MVYRRSVSFELLAVDSPGDGDDEDGSKTVGKSRKRRQRRSKSLKAAASSVSPGRSRSPLGILKSGTTTTSGCSVSTQASSSTEAEKDFGVSIAETSSAAEARQGLDSPSDHVLTVEMQADKGGIQGSGLSPEIPLGSLEEENPAAAAASKSLLVWPLQATQFEPSITTNGGIGELVFAQRSPRPFAELRQRSVADNHSDMMTVQQENGIEGGGGGARGSSTKIVSFKEAADPSYLGRVHAVEPLGHRTPPQARQPLASFGTPHLTEWDRLMAANSDCKSHSCPQTNPSNTLASFCKPCNGPLNLMYFLQNVFEVLGFLLATDLMVIVVCCNANRLLSICGSCVF